MCQNNSVVEVIHKDIIESGLHYKLNRREIPNKIRVLSDEWTPDNHMLTAALKLKRTSIHSKYKKYIESMFWWMFSLLFSNLLPYYPHAGIGEDDHLHEKGIMVSIPACRYKPVYAFSQKFSPSSYTFFIIQICLTFIHFSFKSIVWKMKFTWTPLLIQNCYIYHFFSFA